MTLASPVLFLALVLAGDFRRTDEHGTTWVRPDHLEPDPAIPMRWSGGYRDLVAEALLDEPDRVGCEVLVFEPFDSEWSICLARDASWQVPRVIAREIDAELRSAPGVVGLQWSLDSTADEIARVHEVRTALARTTRRWEVRLDEPTAELLGRVWTALLAEVRYPGYRSSTEDMCDGVVYHVSHDVPDVGDRTGRTKSPEPGMVLHEFVMLVEDLRELAKAPPVQRPARLGAIERRARDVLDRLTDARR